MRWPIVGLVVALLVACAACSALEPDRVAPKAVTPFPRMFRIIDSFETGNAAGGPEFKIRHFVLRISATSPSRSPRETAWWA